MLVAASVFGCQINTLIHAVKIYVFLCYSGLITDVVRICVYLLFAFRCFKLLKRKRRKPKVFRRSVIIVYFGVHTACIIIIVFCGFASFCPRNSQSYISLLSSLASYQSENTPKSTTFKFCPLLLERCSKKRLLRPITLASIYYYLKLKICALAFLLSELTTNV